MIENSIVIWEGALTQERELWRAVSNALSCLRDTSEILLKNKNYKRKIIFEEEEVLSLK